MLSNGSGFNCNNVINGYNGNGSAFTAGNKCPSANFLKTAATTAPFTNSSTNKSSAILT